ncbi:hypothetical protein [Parasitella parasitica]|uniref:Uncharacterized protein n=1 Tax=Parasitella parasitica TaxID=35722 RepID=A0A0B7NJ91_9FUNG|nr:hypothetical protein [Parasitella parasitica]
MNTTIRDNDKLARESNTQIMHGPQVERMMQQQTTLSAQSIDVCENGCELYNLEDEATECQYCSHDRFDTRNSNKPFQTMKIMSIGDIISRLIANPVTREELRYRHIIWMLTTTTTSSQLMKWIELLSEMYSMLTTTNGLETRFSPKSTILEHAFKTMGS